MCLNYSLLSTHVLNHFWNQGANKGQGFYHFQQLCSTAFFVFGVLSVCFYQLDNKGVSGLI